MKGVKRIMTSRKCKTVLGIMLILLALIVFGACSKKSGSQGTSAPDASGTEADKYPDGPVLVTVGQAAGGSTDLVARTIQPYFSKYLGANVVVENVTGGSGKTNLAQFAKAKADGYTLLFTVLPAWKLTQTVDTNPSYNIETMVPIYNLTGGDYNAFAVPANSGISTIDDLVRESKNKTITMSGSGIGGNGYFAYFLLKTVTGADIKFVPFNSGGEAVTAMIGGHVDTTVSSVVSFEPRVKEGSLRVIATTGPDRAHQFPDVPTLEDLGYKGAAYNVLFGFMGPQGLPTAIRDKIAVALEKVAKDPEFKAACEKGGLGYAPMNTAEYEAACKEMFTMVNGYSQAFIAATVEAANN